MQGLDSGAMPTVAEEYGGDSGRGEAANNGVEESGRIWKAVSTVVARWDMANDPGSLSGGFTRFKFGDDERENTGLVWICKVEVIEHVCNVPKVGVDGNDTEALGCGMSICSIMRGGVCCFGRVDPAILLPHGAEEVVVPAERIVRATVTAIDIVRCIVCFRQGIMVS